MVKDRKPKVLYLYAGKRKEFYDAWKKGLVADTQLLGLNYMEELGVDASFIEWPFAEGLRKIHFNLVHLPYIFAIRKYDIVFICAGLPLVFLAKYILRWKKPKFVIYNTFLTNALKRNSRGISGFITRKAIENIDMIVCTSNAQETFLIERGFDPKKIIFQHIGIDAEYFAKTRQPATSTDQYILSVGRDPGRDYKTLFEAAEGLSVKIIVATKKEAVAGLVVPRNVEIKFNVPYEDMSEIYAGALFVVTPLRKGESTHGSDTSGQYGYLEPMAGGIAVITANKETVRDYVTDNVDGLLYDPENASNLRQKIDLLLNNPSLRSRLATAGQQKALSHFTSRTFAIALAEIFRNL